MHEFEYVSFWVDTETEIIIYLIKQKGIIFQKLWDIERVYTVDNHRLGCLIIKNKVNK